MRTEPGRPMPRKHRHRHHRREHARKYWATVAGIVDHAWGGLERVERDGRTVEAPIIVPRLARRPDVAAWLASQTGPADGAYAVSWGFAADADKPQAALRIQATGHPPCSFSLVFGLGPELRAIAEAGEVILKPTADRPGVSLPLRVDGLRAFLDSGGAGGEPGSNLLLS